MAVSVSPKSGVGARLKKARVNLGASLAEAARETRIKPRFLEALERDAPPTVFRAPVYARAFLREYATYLKLDPEPLVADYAAVHEEQSGPMRLPQPVERPVRARLLQILLVLASVAVVATLAVVAARPDEVDEPAPAVSSPEARATAPAEPAVEPAEPTYRGVHLVVRIRKEPSWVRVRRGDGETLVRRTARPGFKRTFRAPRRLEVVIGNAAAARLTLNGDPQGTLGDSGEVYRATLVFEDGRARVITR